jgi:uncharacterized membrane protein YbhN (UPF0104 family)
MIAKRQQSRGRLVRALLYVVLLGLLVILIDKQHAALGNAIAQAAAADKWWLGVAVLAMALSLPATAAVYLSLSPKPLRFGRTVLVQTAGFCINKLLPSGSGAAGVSFLYLRANKVSGALAGSIVALNNALGLAGHFILFWLFVALQPAVLGKLQLGGLPDSGTLALLAVCFVLAIAAFALLLRSRLHTLIGTFWAQVKPLLTNRRQLLRALGFSMLITLCYTVTLYASAQAVGAGITLSAAIIALTASVLATSTIPSPGGIGAAELGAYGGLVAVGVDSQAALAAALLYRVCSFWLPLAFGSLAFAVVAKRGYLRASSKH